MERRKRARIATEDICTTAAVRTTEASLDESVAPRPDATALTTPSPRSNRPYLLHLPVDVLQDVLSYLDCKSLVRMQAVCSTFKGRSQGHLACSHQQYRQQDSLVEKAAESSMLRKYEGLTQEASRWQGYSWLMRKRIDETQSPFDWQRCERSGFKFMHGPDGEVQKVKLEGIGPKMLVSEQTTRNTEFLHWRLELRGNNAVELGVVPESLQDMHKSLHKCLANQTNERPTGICSSITVGSLLPVRLPLMKGSDIELLAWPNKLELLINQPSEGFEMTWINSNTVPRKYQGPRHFKFEINVAIQGPAKLAITCWAHAEFMVIRSGLPRPVADAASPPGVQAAGPAAGEGEHGPEAPGLPVPPAGAAAGNGEPAAPNADLAVAPENVDHAGNGAGAGGVLNGNGAGFGFNMGPAGMADGHDNDTDDDGDPEPDDDEDDDDDGEEMGGAGGHEPAPLPMLADQDAAQVPGFGAAGEAAMVQLLQPAMAALGNQPALAGQDDAAFQALQVAVIQALGDVGAGHYGAALPHPQAAGGQQHQAHAWGTDTDGSRGVGSGRLA